MFGGRVVRNNCLGFVFRVILGAWKLNCVCVFVFFFDLGRFEPMGILNEGMVSPLFGVSEESALCQGVRLRS